METWSRHDLRDWLHDKPSDWGQIVAVRAALRTVPFIGRAGEKWLERNAIAPIRANAISWAARNFPSRDMVAAAGAAAEADYQARPTPDLPHAASYAAIFAADAAMYAATATSTAGYAEAGDAVDAAAYAAEGAADAAALSDQFWEAIEQDCRWLIQRSGDATASRVMTRRSLWLGRPSAQWSREWQSTKRTLLSIDPAYAVWTDWFDRRIRGERAAFSIPHDKARREDKAILARLADATDADFWDKGAAYVNAALQGWLNDARTRAHPNRVIDVDRKARLPSPTRNAVQFHADVEGRIGINGTALADELRTDVDARDRHAESVAMAKAMLSGCQGSNAGARLIAMIEAYLDAAGESIETIRPSLFVQRGERLRQELAAYEMPDTMLAPLVDAVLLDGKSWRSAHNMAVGLDPVLMALDTAQLGPDAQPVPLAPDDIRRIARDADAEGALAEGVAEVVVEAANLAPELPNPADRRTNWSSETGRNLVIELFAVALNHPLTTLSGVATFGAFGWAGAAVFGGGLAAAKFLVSHRDWLEKRMGETPTWRGLFVQLCDRLEQLTPFRPKSDDDGVN